MSWLAIGFAWIPHAGWWLTDLALRGSLLLLAVLAVLALSRQRSAAHRHLFGMAGLLALPLLPLAMLWLPTGLGVMPSFFARAARATGAAASPAATPGVAWVVLVVMWAVGTLLLAVRAHVASRRLQRFFDDGDPWPAAADLLRSARGSLTLPATPEVRTSDAVDVPLTFGALRSKILLPSEAVTWDRDRLQWVLLHEQAHIARHDPMAQAATIAVSCLFWWQPLIWRLGRRLELDREHAADDLVLAHRGDAVGYAKLLVDFAESLRGRPMSAFGLSMARPSQLNARLRAMLDETADRRRSGPVQALAACGALSLLLLLVAATPGEIRFGETFSSGGFASELSTEHGHGHGGGHGSRGHASGDHSSSGHASGHGLRGHASGHHDSRGHTARSGHAGRQVGHGSAGHASGDHRASVNRPGPWGGEEPLGP